MEDGGCRYYQNVLYKCLRLSKSELKILFKKNKSDAMLKPHIS